MGLVAVCQNRGILDVYEHGLVRVRVVEDLVQTQLLLGEIA